MAVAGAARSELVGSGPGRVGKPLMARTRKFKESAQPHPRLNHTIIIASLDCCTEMENSVNDMLATEPTATTTPVIDPAYLDRLKANLAIAEQTLGTAV